MNIISYIAPRNYLFALWKLLGKHIRWNTTLYIHDYTNRPLSSTIYLVPLEVTQQKQEILDLRDQRPALSTQEHPCKITMTTKRMHGDTMGIEKEIEPIRPGGDLLLEVGGRWGFEPTLLLVSADWLCAVSPVFKVMLTGSFQEASTPRSPETPQKIQLPSDSWTGIRDMCALVHHNLKNIGTSRSWSASRVFALAQTIDKYLCKEALHLQMQAIFAQYFEELEQRTELAENLGQVATAAYLLQDGRAFEKATLHLLMDCRGRYDRLHLYATSGILPWSVLCESKQFHDFDAFANFNPSRARREENPYL